MRRSRRALLTVLAAIALSVLTAGPAHAQLVGTDTAPGESCAGVAAGATRVTADADQDGKEVTLICDGSAWQPAGGSTSAASPDRGIQFNSAGELAADGSFNFSSAGRLGIGTTSPGVALDVSGIMRAIDDAASCTAAERGAIRFNSVDAKVEFCDGAAWGALFELPTCPLDDTLVSTSSGWRCFSCTGPPDCQCIGDICADGSVYAGLTPGGGVQMYTTPADAGQYPWNNGNTTYPRCATKRLMRSVSPTRLMSHSAR